MKFSTLSNFNYEIKSLRYGYPDFVYKNIDSLGVELPVFVLHSIDPKEFEDTLLFLKAGGYRTTSLNSYYDKLIGNSDVENDILLTVDDGRLSFWKYAFPLLKKHNMNATLFIVPGVISEADIEVRPNLEDCWERGMSEEELANLDPEDLKLCSWEELKIMKKSGLVDIDSHSLFHREVFVDNTVIDFIDESTRFTLYNSSFSPYYQLENRLKPINKSEFYGLPLFRSQPLLLGKKAYTVSKKLKIFCKEFYLANKSSASWKKELLLKIKHRLDDEVLGQNQRELESAIKDDLKFASEEISRRLGTNCGKYLCFPYSAGSDLSVSIAGSLGIKASFWGVRTSKSTNKPGDNPQYVVRLKSDFINRLPSAGRVSLYAVYLDKIKRRLLGKAIY